MTKNQKVQKAAKFIKIFIILYLYMIQKLILLVQLIVSAGILNEQFKISISYFYTSDTNNNIWNYEGE